MVIKYTLLHYVCQVYIFARCLFQISTGDLNRSGPWVESKTKKAWHPASQVRKDYQGEIYFSVTSPECTIIYLSFLHWCSFKLLLIFNSDVVNKIFASTFFIHCYCFIKINFQVGITGSKIMNIFNILDSTPLLF